MMMMMVVMVMMVMVMVMVMYDDGDGDGVEDQDDEDHLLLSTIVPRLERAHVVLGLGRPQKAQKAAAPVQAEADQQHPQPPFHVRSPDPCP